MSTEFWIAQSFNGLSYGALLFLLASGLSLIFGVMRIVNLAHGSYFMLGGYVGLTWRCAPGVFTLACLAAAVAIGARRHRHGALLPPPAARPGAGPGAHDHRLRADLPGPGAADLGRRSLHGADPARSDRHRAAGGACSRIYRIFIVGVAVVVGLALWLVLDRTRVGAMIRAAVDDAEMAQGVGIDVPRVSLAVFALGAALAALGGVIGGGFLGVYPGPTSRCCPTPSWWSSWAASAACPGAMAGSLLVGLLDNFGKALFPELSYFTLFAPMALILAHPPDGPLRPRDDRRAARCLAAAAVVALRSWRRRSAGLSADPADPGRSSSASWP